MLTPGTLRTLRSDRRLRAGGPTTTLPETADPVGRWMFVSAVIRRDVPAARAVTKDVPAVPVTAGADAALPPYALSRSGSVLGGDVQGGAVQT
ncbi:hypothetical protein GCM10017600_48630 [Streptosporangium carneum]|uniref:Uncharacterized protein n=1 Tax=Streptosporangium carneum TaxID=47481 RepID=A0A9W6MER2_9ACTN|nr:hypothetical protein GCM10017600_48630 [Streptosporangium carneum]